MAEQLAAPVALVVDDDLSYRVFMRQYLELAGFTVIMEGSGQIALRRLEQQKVDVLVTDLFMPEVDGLELIELARRGFPQMRVVAVSGGGTQGDTGYLRVARLFGAHATLQKPFSGSELIAAVAPERAAPESEAKPPG
ncbi:MAG TPA: response regulator [Stellaceae bacterium]|nr:response regulator [Stellaceae bacterium]